MSKILLAIALLSVAMLVVAACSSADEAIPTTRTQSAAQNASEILNLELSPQESTIDEGASRQFAAVATMADGTRVDVASGAQWRSSDESIVSLSAAGLARALASGKANITVEVEGVSSDAVTLEVFVPFATEDGVTLRGRLFGGGRTIVILSHMFPADQTSWYPFAQVLAQNGYAAFTFDFRGYGVSEGKRTIPDIDKDLMAALELARGRGMTNVFLMGASMGGTVSVKVAARESISGVVTISAPIEFRGLDAEGDIFSVFEPKLFVAAEGDRSAAVSASSLWEAAEEPKELAILAGSAHGTNIFNAPEGEELQQLLLRFLMEQAPQQ